LCDWPADAHRQLRNQAYRQAEAALLRNFPHAAIDGYAYGLVGQGWNFVDVPLPECTCTHKKPNNDATK
jgi:hypothetical protein